MSQILLQGAARSAQSPQSAGRPTAGAGARGSAPGRRSGVDRAGLGRMGPRCPHGARARISTSFCLMAWLAILVVRPCPRTARVGESACCLEPAGRGGSAFIHGHVRAGDALQVAGSSQQLCARRCGGIPVHRRRDRNYSDFADGTLRRCIATSMETSVWRAHPEVDGVPGRTDGAGWRCSDLTTGSARPSRSPGIYWRVSAWCGHTLLRTRADDRRG